MENLFELMTCSQVVRCQHALQRLDEAAFTEELISTYMDLEWLEHVY